MLLFTVRDHAELGITIVLGLALVSHKVALRKPPIFAENDGVKFQLDPPDAGVVKFNVADDVMPPPLICARFNFLLVPDNVTPFVSTVIVQLPTVDTIFELDNANWGPLRL